MFRNFPSSSPPSMSSLAPSTMPTKKRLRPRGLWKARVTPHNRPHDNLFHDSDSDDHDEDYDTASESTSHSKRQRFSPVLSEETSEEDETYYFDFARQSISSDHPLPHHRESCWSRRTRIMDTTTTAARGLQTNVKKVCTFEDWEDLKDLFNKALEQCESQDSQDALPLVRGVIHDCHRFLNAYQDPSVLFSTHAQSADGTATIPIEEIDWTVVDKTAALQPRHRLKSDDLPTAFHTILGTALFLFGSLIDQDPSLSLEGEPDLPIPYWLAALDVFETGETLPSRTRGYGIDTAEDWKMSIVWGRTLVAIADDTMKRAARSGDNDFTVDFSEDTIVWSPDSPFSAIAASRPPMTRRMTLASTTANDLMVLAMDQLTRGIFHMPHQHTKTYMSGFGSSCSVLVAQESFSRAKELYTVASDVLSVAENMTIPSERQEWASYAESIFYQMKLEADMDEWRGHILLARGKCLLTVATAGIDPLEEALDRGDASVYFTEEAEESRRVLTQAIEYFERAKGFLSDAPDDSEVIELKKLLGEAFLTLANITANEKEREALYVRATAENTDIELDMMDCD